MPHIFLETKGLAIPAPAVQIKADKVFTLPQGLFACGGGSEAGKGCAGAADVESLQAPGAPAAAGVAVGMGMDRTPSGKHSSAQG